MMLSISKHVEIQMFNCTLFSKRRKKRWNTKNEKKREKQEAPFFKGYAPAFFPRCLSAGDRAAFGLDPHGDDSRPHYSPLLLVFLYALAFLLFEP